MFSFEDEPRDINFLVNNRNPDFGWGLTVNQESSIVNTYEVCDILARLDYNKYENQISEAFDFVNEKMDKVLKNKTIRARYIIYAIALLEINRKKNNVRITELINILLDGRNKEDCWGEKLSDNTTNIYHTCIAIRVLYKNGHEEIVNKSIDSLIHKIFDKEIKNKNELLLYISLYVSTMKYIGHEIPDDKLKISKKILLKANFIDLYFIENISGTSWKHFIPLWYLDSLLKIKTYKFSTIINIRDKIEKLKSDGSIFEEEGQKTVRYIFNVLHSERIIKEIFNYHLSKSFTMNKKIIFAIIILGLLFIFLILLINFLDDYKNLFNFISLVVGITGFNILFLIERFLPRKLNIEK